MTKQEFAARLQHACEAVTAAEAGADRDRLQIRRRRPRPDHGEDRRGHLEGGGRL